LPFLDGFRLHRHACLGHPQHGAEQAISFDWKKSEKTHDESCSQKFPEQASVQLLLQRERHHLGDRGVHFQAVLQMPSIQWQFGRKQSVLLSQVPMASGQGLQLND
jgi:hypothetical protein